MKIYFQEKMQVMINRLNKSSDKHISENYFKKLAKAEPLPTTDARFHMPITGTTKSIQSFATMIDPHKQFELKKIQRANEFKMNMDIHEQNKDFSTNLVHTIKEFETKNQTNIEAVKDQLVMQDDKIKAKLDERRMNSVNKSISHSVSKISQLTPSKSENRLHPARRPPKSVDPLPKIVSIRFEDEYEDIGTTGLLSKIPTDNSHRQ